MRRLPLLLAALALLPGCGGSAGSPPFPGTNVAGPPPPPGLAGYQGCQVFAAGDYYNAAIGGAPADPRSSQYVSSLISGGGRARGLYVGMTTINIASNATPLISVNWTAHRAPGGVTRWPWEPSFAVSPTRDRHALVFQRDTCRIYETYGTIYNGNLAAYSGADWDLRAAFAPLPYDTPSSLASGLSLFAGMIKAREIASGFIGHALDIAPPAGTIAAHLFVRPASYTGGAPYTGTMPAYELPWGAHLRLKASYDISGFPPQARTILQALKDYGAYIADTGGVSVQMALYGESSSRWNARDLWALDEVPWSAFEVLPLGQIVCDPGYPCP